MPVDPTPLDAERYAADLMARAQRMYADATSRSHELASLGVTAEQGDVRVRVSPGGVLDELVVADGAAVNPVRLSQDATTAYEAALRALTSAVASRSGGLDAQIMAYAPEEPTEPVPGAGGVEVTVDEAEELPELPIDAQFESLLSMLDDTPDDLQRFVDHPEFRRLSPQGDPTTWQHDLQAQVQAISANADELAEASRTIVGTHETPELTVEVGTSGRVERLLFKNAVRQVPPERVGGLVMEAYAAARTKAEQRLAGVVDDLGYADVAREDRP
ncbi:hypothetical protein GCM10027418_01920 [Mariniluteicoccus endophyticus]